MNYKICLKKCFSELDVKSDNYNKVFSSMLKNMEVEIINKLSNNELINFIYPTINVYNDEDKINLLNKHFNINCKNINEFSQNIKLDDNIIISIINNLNNNEVINSVCNLINIYKEVYICNLYYDNPYFNIHYVICKNKITDDNKLKIINNNICINNNLNKIYKYLYSYYSSLLYIIKLYNKKNVDVKKLYNEYCDLYKDQLYKNQPL